MKQETSKRDRPPMAEKHVRLSGPEVIEEQQSDRFASLQETLAALKRKRRAADEISQDANEQLRAEPEQQRDPPSRRSELPRQLEQEKQSCQKSIVSKLKDKITGLKRTVAEHQQVIDRLEKRNAELVQENNALKVQLDRRTDAMPSNPEQVFRKAANCVLHEKVTEEILPDPNQLCRIIEVELGRFTEQCDGQAVHILSPVQGHLAKAKELMQFELPDALTIPHTTGEIQSILYQTVVLLVDGFSPYRLRKTVGADMFGKFYQNHLPNILRAADLEFVPIEIGQTQADARIHDIQGTQAGPFNLGVVVDIVQQGLRKCSDQKIIRKPVVIRGEPE